MMKGSWGVGVEGVLRLTAVFELHTVSDFGVHPLTVLHDVLEASHSVAAHLLGVENAVVDAVNTGTAIETTSVETQLEALGAVTSSIGSVAALALVADGGKKGPATCTTMEVCLAAGLITGPDINAAGGITGALVAAEAGADLVDAWHTHG